MKLQTFLTSIYSEKILGHSIYDKFDAKKIYQALQFYNEWHDWLNNQTKEDITRLQIEYNNLKMAEQLKQQILQDLQLAKAVRESKFQERGDLND